MTVRVALFATCLADQFFAEACADAVRLLRHLGADVDVPGGQTCCGQPSYNSGHRDDARRMVAHTLDVLPDTDYVVLPSGSCAGMIRSFYPELDTSGRGAELAGRTYELAEFLVRVLGVDSLGTGLKGLRVAYHHGCHALRELRVEEEPLTLLRGAGAEIVSWEAEQECCGFGGLFATKLPEISAGMADRKLDTVPREVDVVTSADGGCLLQLQGRASNRGEVTAFRHIAQLLWQGVDA